MLAQGPGPFNQSPRAHGLLTPAAIGYNAPMIAAVIQMNSTADRAANLAQAEELLRRAGREGAALAVLPEHFSFMQSEGRRPPAPEGLDGPLVSWLGGLARKLGLWIVGGSFSRRAPGGRRVYNTCPLLDASGRLAAHYSKTHLFDLNLPGRPALSESTHTRPGQRLAVAETPLGPLGLSICYDLRFPELYRRLRLKGALHLAAPSAFTRATGQAHWEMLVRARAVENACSVLAAAQEGDHGGGRASFGRAMIVGPWGDILAECPPGPGVALARVDAELVLRSRRKLDSTAHARLLPAAWRED